MRGGGKGLIYYPELQDAIDNRNEQRSYKSYDQHIGTEVVLHDWKVEKSRKLSESTLDIITSVQGKVAKIPGTIGQYMKLINLMAQKSNLQLT